MTQTESQSDVLDGPSTPSLKVEPLPLQDWGFYNCPAIPFWADANGDSGPHALATDDRAADEARERGG